MEALKENPSVAQKIEEVRKQTRDEKKRLAMAMREKQLGELGMHTNEKGQVTAKSSILKQMEDLGEEAGLVCIICREGYKFQPSKLLGIYTFTKRCNLDDYEAKPRKTPGYTTVTHFNIVHVDCHMAAVRHNTYIQDCTGHLDVGYMSTLHDLKLLLSRFAFERSFSEDSGGGGPQSNMHLIPYLLHMVLYVINTTRCVTREEKNLSNFLEMSPDRKIENFYERVSCSTDDGWSVALADYIRHNDQQHLELGDKLLRNFEEQVLTCQSFMEYCDVMGLLCEIPNPDAFLLESLQLRI
ncbi:hypothetical protein HPB50_004249 [Hyalomma asiaticum]|uniref:Uncharacterized protein n=1 Tax=Hyalomma asiaticum TaxID=266040 RepID=A0ACB7TC14_HYAAI|nr:hypothetical protein HPB50_004249 [Hyalomma asiaticum]